MVGSIGRTFLAVPIPFEVRASLAARLADCRLPGREVGPANWHITLRFFGETSDLQLDRLLYGLSTILDRKPWRMEVGGFGAFPNSQRATVMWMGITGGGRELGEIAEVAESVAQNAGFPPEDRPFHPHLTLSRIRPHQDVSELVDDADLGWFRWMCSELIIFRTDLQAGGVRYEPLDILSFG